MKNRIIFLCLVAFLFSALSCVRKEEMILGKFTQKETFPKIGTIISLSENFTGKKVVLKVRCLGWRDCPDSVMVTRSDVVIADDTGCIYVKGGLRRNLWGKQLIVHGTVHVLKGKPYMEVDSVEVKE
ncbi:hypothetical protein [Desulfurobacterium atlanticum]|uniref:Uncharacterized protein n=1 Tax=Desulfurobacterium atlanticum TaxID=240169 RepID=A0A238ZCF5_9BACT|nr:hypothetical protein [Desulfurobacterium atlanticum]SNR80678.1 hypothetical protein SAMN06265340_10794 [Desulfurobacterium atlanticum]